MGTCNRTLGGTCWAHKWPLFYHLYLPIVSSSSSIMYKTDVFPSLGPSIHTGMVNHCLILLMLRIVVIRVYILNYANIWWFYKDNSRCKEYRCSGLNMPREGWTFIVEMIAIHSIISQRTWSKDTIPRELYKGSCNRMQQIQRQQCATAQEYLQSIEYLLNWSWSSFVARVTAFLYCFLSSCHDYNSLS